VVVRDLRLLVGKRWRCSIVGWTVLLGNGECLVVRLARHHFLQVGPVLLANVLATWGAGSGLKQMV
jgi:hypothetical protein